MTRIAWTAKEWQAVHAAITLLSIKNVPRAVRYTTISDVASFGRISRQVARNALGRLEEHGVIYASAPASGSAPAMFRARWHR